jgi:hypothetical protein
MTTLGLCTHFTRTDEWAFEYALHLSQARGWKMTICHWLRSPYILRRDLVQADLFQNGEPLPVTQRLLNKLELKLREYYDPKLGGFTNVAFKLCEGQYQVELVRCFRKNLLDVVVMGYQPPGEEYGSGTQPLEEFAQRLAYPLIIVGKDGPESFLLNPEAVKWLDQLDLEGVSWETLHPQHATISS